MAFAGINYLAVLIAAVASWLVRAFWYMALAKPWMAAVGMTPEQMPQGRRRLSAICLSVPGEPDHRLGARRPARSILAS
jgi:hypothetical protein